MIKLLRKRKDSDEKWIRPSTQWRSNAEAATKKALKEEGKHAVNEEIIGDPALRMTLEELFYYKCVYCESCLEEAGWDVEHFRPKGRVAEDSLHPGYYWLAYKWTNLYASCKFCNQARRDAPIWGDPKYKPAAGKADQFPVADEKTRARTPADSIAKEKNLLLDPCRDEPDRYLTYDPTGQIFSIKAGDDRARATIDVFNLRRRRLVRRRKRVISKVMKAMEDVAELRKEGQKGKAQRAKKRVWEVFCEPDDAWAGAARAVWADPERFSV